MKYVIEPAIRLRPLNRQDVQRLFDDTDNVPLPLTAGADAAGIGLRHILADGAEADLLFHLQDGCGQSLCFHRRHAQEIVSKTLGALGADARKLVELFYEAGKRRRCRRDRFVQAGNTSAVAISCAAALLRTPVK